MENEEQVQENMNCLNMDISAYFKPLLTIEEAARVFNIGMNKIREISGEPGCEYVLFVGNKRLIKKDKFKFFLEGQSVI